MRRVLLALALLVGCGSETVTVPPAPPPPPDPPGPDLPADPDALFLEVRLEGGFAPLEHLIGRPPVLALTVGGDLYYEGPQIEIWPPPLLPSMIRTELPPALGAVVIGTAVAAGLPEADDDLIVQPGGPTDQPTWIFIFRDADGERRIRVSGFYAPTDVDPRVPLLRELLDALFARTAELPGEPYRGDRIQAFVSRDDRPSDDEYRHVLPWPLPEPPPPPGAAEFECRIHEGEAAVVALEAFAGANFETRWDHEGDVRMIVPRPLIPAEPGCEPRGSGRGTAGSVRPSGSRRTRRAAPPRPPRPRP